MKVTLSKPKGSQIHVSQAVPRSRCGLFSFVNLANFVLDISNIAYNIVLDESPSSLKWKLDGNADDNQVHVSQVKTQLNFKSQMIFV